MFIDRVTVKLNAGKGGNGAVAWRREKYVPKGGPYGGNGGFGGSIVIVAEPSLHSLDWFRNRSQLKAENGRTGGTGCRKGREGRDLILRVPCGTLVKDAETGALLADLTKPGEKIYVCLGGKGGRGNASFKTSINRAPNQWTEGDLGDEKRIELELKLIAEVGLVGFPNAGKSTLVGALTKAKAKVGAYPFTTLAPNLGKIHFEDYTSAYIADIPGIIEGAHENRGLGLEFLRHVERTKVLIYVLDTSGIDGRTPLDDLRVLRKEVQSKSPEILERPFLIALNKCEVPESKEHIEAFLKATDVDPKLIFHISAMEKQGLEPLLDAIYYSLKKK